jgi:hypothetical protein
VFLLTVGEVIVARTVKIVERAMVLDYKIQTQGHLLQDKPMKEYQSSRLNEQSASGSWRGVTPVLCHEEVE